MHITLEADYAVRIVAFLARENTRCDASRISDATGVSLRFSLKILRNLVSAGIIKSFKGASGGYEINRPANEITLKDILYTIEGEYMFSRCLEGTPCTNPNSDSCKVQGVFRDISAMVNSKLASVTVADVIAV